MTVWILIFPLNKPFIYLFISTIGCFCFFSKLYHLNVSSLIDFIIFISHKTRHIPIVALTMLVLLFVGSYSIFSFLVSAYSTSLGPIRTVGPSSYGWLFKVRTRNKNCILYWIHAHIFVLIERVNLIFVLKFVLKLWFNSLNFENIFFVLFFLQTSTI